MPKIRGSCLNCGGAPTIDAHLFPDAFIKDIRAGGPKIVIADPDGGAFKTSPSGEYDAAILCAVCDGGVLGPVEQAAIEWTRHRKTMSHNHIERVTVPGDGNALIRFAAEICWKYSVAHERFDRPYAGPHLDTLRAIAFGSAAPPRAANHCRPRPRPAKPTGWSIPPRTAPAVLKWLRGQPSDRLPRKPSPIDGV